MEWVSTFREKHAWLRFHFEHIFLDRFSFKYFFNFFRCSGAPYIMDLLAAFKHGDCDGTKVRLGRLQVRLKVKLQTIKPISRSFGEIWFHHHFHHHHFNIHFLPRLIMVAAYQQHKVDNQPLSTLPFWNISFSLGDASIYEKIPFSGRCRLPMGILERVFGSGISFLRIRQHLQCWLNSISLPYGILI